jgi:hypothetical protein
MIDTQWGSGSLHDLERLGQALFGGETAADYLDQVPSWLKIRNRLGNLASLKPNDAQKLYADKSWKHPRNIVLKARQMGITTWIAGQFFLKTITHAGTVTVQVAHTQEAAEQIFRIVHRFFQKLPDPLRQGALKSAKLSARHLRLPELDSEYLVETAGDRNAGRGLTISNLHCTELAHWPGDATDTLCGLLATLSPTGSLVIESTPMGSSGCFWHQWRDAAKTNTIPHFFPWWLESAYALEPIPAESLTDDEKECMQKNNLSLEKIAYRRRILADFHKFAPQEYAEDAETCFLLSGACYFDVPAIDARLRDLPPAIEEAERIGLSVWYPPIPDHQYLVAVDPAGGGIDGDCTAIQVIDLDNAVQCAEAAEHMSLEQAAREARALALRYNGALVVVERNGIGEGVLSHLNGVHKYDRLYQADDGRPGWKTTSASRDSMLGTLEAQLAQCPWIYSSERLLREFRSFVRQKNGTYSAQAGQHDDCVLAMAVAQAARHDYMSDPRFRPERIRHGIAGPAGGA